MLVQLTEDNFEAEVLRSNKPVMVDYWSQQCGQCKMISRIVEQIAEEMAGVAKVGMFDVGSNINFAVRQKISSLPTLQFYKEGKLVSTITGATSKDNILAHFNPILS